MTSVDGLQLLPLPSDDQAMDDVQGHWEVMGQQYDQYGAPPMSSPAIPAGYIHHPPYQII
jgi:hypothetical protein